MRLRLFKRTKTDEYHFQFLSNQDQVLLNSQGYQSKNARSTGINSVYNNAGDPSKYSKQSTNDGKFFFILRAGNNQEIARSPEFDSEGAADKAINQCVQGIPPLNEDNPYATDGRSDNYKPLAFYNNRIESVADGFQTFSAEEKHWFTYNSGGGILLISEGYGSESGRDNGIASVEKNLKIADRYQYETHPNGKSYFNLRAGNNQEIATSIWFDSEGDMQNAVNNVISATKPKKKRKRRAKKPKVEKIEVGSGNYPCSDITYKIFRSGNGKHYFTYRDKEDKAILISSNIRGYATLEETEGIIRQIEANGSKANNFEERTTTNNKFYYYLKNDKGKNIGKSFFFDTEDEMRSAMKLFDCGAAGVKVTAAAGAGSATSGKRDDDYLVCSAYEGHEADTDGFCRFENGGEHFFAMLGKEGTVKLRSERYTSTAGRDNGIASVKKNRELSERYSIEEARNIFYVILKAGNHQEIARSCPYKTRQEAEAHISDPLGIAAAEAVAKAKAEARAKRDAEALAIAKEREQREGDQSGKTARADDYLKCSEYEGHEIGQDGFSRFKHDGEFYFAMHDSDGKVRLRSEGYTTEKARDNGIDSVKRNRDNEKRWSTEEKMGYHFVILKAGNHQEIGRSCPYEDAAAAAGFVSGAAGSYAAAGIAAGLGALSTEGSAEAAAKAEADKKAAAEAEAARIAAEKKAAEQKAAAEAAKIAAEKKAAEEKTAAEAEAARIAAEKKAAQEKAARIAAEKEEEKKKAAAAALAAGASAASTSGGSAKGAGSGATTADTAATSKEGRSRFPWWLLLALLALALFFLLWKGCGICNTPKDAVPPAAVEEPAMEQESEIVAPVEPEVQEEEATEVEPEPEAEPEPTTTTLANSPSHPLFNLPPVGSRGTKLPYLGSNPEFGDSHGLSPEEFYNKLKARYDANPKDRRFLDDVFKAMGYVNGFAAATPAMFSSVELPAGTTGNLGFSADHKTGYYTLPDRRRDRMAFKITGANGRDLHFMKTCGNHFYFRT